MQVDAVEELLQHHRVKLLYTIPSFHNPGGQTMSLGRRKRLVELSRSHDFLIAADEVYQLLHFYDPPPAAFGTLIEDGNVISLGSFSKIMAPGLRLGWIQTAPELMQKLLDNGAINSGGSLNHFTSHVIRHAIELGLQQKWLEHLRRSYRNRAESMDAALHQHLGHMARWHRPQGGYFFWLEFDPLIDTARLRNKAAEFQTGFQPGINFSPEDGLQNYLRLSFAHYNETDIVKGISRLADLVKGSG
jgi:2-aminoadipate transaminase